MKILLIDPPLKSFTGIVSFYFPLGLAYLAACVKRDGFECTILDVDAVEGKSGTLDFAHEYERYHSYVQGLNNPHHPTWELLRTLVLEQKPDIIGITALTTKFGSVIQTARFCKELLPKIPIIVGGAHATAMPELTLQIPQVDVVVRGEGDETFPELLKTFRDKGDLSKVSGISFREGERVIHNPDRPIVADLDSLPIPDRNALLHLKNYSSEDMGVMLTSRGCPFNCSYCFHLWNRKVRFRSITKVLDEIRLVRKSFGTPQFSFKDDSFTVNKQRVHELCASLGKEPYRISWNCTTRVDIIDDKLLKAMKKSGCNAISIGVESGSARILRETNKGITHEQIRKAAKLLNKNHIFWSGYFMIGLPNETEDDIQKTFSFLKEVNPYYAGLGVYNPFPATALFDQGVRFGLLDASLPLDHFLSTNPKDLFFKDYRHRVQNISQERFKELCDEAMCFFHRHNTNPYNMLRRGLARRRVYFQDPSLLWRDLTKVAGLLGFSFGH